MGGSGLLPAGLLVVFDYVGVAEDCVGAGGDDDEVGCTYCCVCGCAATV